MTASARRMALAAAVLAAACKRLPEAGSPAAQLYVTRCAADCHRIYYPGTMKYPMWEMVVERMQTELPRRGVPPLTEKEKAIILEYLRRHAG